MAKHRKHRKYGALSTLTFGAIKLPQSVPTKGLAIGVVVGLAGAVGARYAWNHFAPAATKANALAVDTNTGKPVNAGLNALNQNLPTVGAIVLALAAYFGLKKKNPSLASAVAIGSAAAGIAIGGLGVLQSIPAFQGLQVVKLGAHRYGALLVGDGNRPGFGAMVVDAGSSYVPGYNRAAGSSAQNGRMGAMLIAGQNPKMGALIAQHAAMRARRVGSGN